MQTRCHRFDFALSFAGSDRPQAEALCSELKNLGFRVFYDRDYEHEMVGRNGADYLREVYSRETRYCLVLLSRSYEQSTWTQLEKESIQARQLRGEDGILIPIRVESYLPPWLPETRIYFDLCSRPLSELIVVLRRLGRSDTMALQDVRSQDDLYRALPGTTWRKKNDVEHLVFREGGLVFNNHAGHPAWRENYYRIEDSLGLFTIIWTVDGYVAQCQLSHDFSEFIEVANPEECAWRLVSLKPHQPPWGI